MKWASENLNGTDFYSSGDDDVIVNLAELVKVIKWLKKRVLSDNWPDFPFICSLCAKIGNYPSRKNGTKYYTSFEEYKWPFWPDFCLGGAYTTSVKVASQLWNASRGVKPIKMDDVWITGVLREKIGMPRQFVRQILPPLAKHYFGYIGSIANSKRTFMQKEWQRVIKQFENSTMCTCS